MARWILGLVLSLGVASPAAAQSFTAPPVEVVLSAETPDVPTDWIDVEGTWLVVHGPADAAPLLTHLARHGSDALPRLSEALGAPIGGTIHVMVADSDAEFHAVQPGAVPEWADGTAWPDKGWVFLRRPKARASDRPLEQVLEHELVHVLLGRAFAPALPPQWLQEGVATVLSHEYGAEHAAALAGGAPDLTELEYGFPRDAAGAARAYAASADFVAWLRAEHGADALPALVRASARGGLAAAVREVTGSPLAEVQRAWAATHDASLPIRLATAANGDTLLALAALGGLGGLVAARRRTQRRIREMAEDEARLDALLASLRWGDGPFRAEA
jgi:hypothetical protein